MFFFGCFFPLFWLIGAFMTPTSQEYAPELERSQQEEGGERVTMVGRVS